MLLEKLKQLLKEDPKGLIKNREYKRYLTVEREGIKINLKKLYFFTTEPSIFRKVSLSLSFSNIFSLLSLM